MLDLDQDIDKFMEDLLIKDKKIKSDQAIEKKCAYEASKYLKSRKILKVEDLCFIKEWEDDWNAIKKKAPNDFVID